MFSHDGRDDKLYRGAILESGGVTGAQVSKPRTLYSNVSLLTPE
jgi:hypothetical protein